VPPGSDSRFPPTPGTRPASLIDSGSSYVAIVERYNVKAYGAKGDGTTDDTAAISSAITAANGVGEVFLPPGTYIVRGLTITTPNTRIIGTGTGSVLKLKAESTGDGMPMVYVTTGDGAQFSNLYFDGNKANQAADGFSDSFSQGLAVGTGLGRSYRAAIVAYDPGGSTHAGLTITDCSFVNTFGAALATQNFNSIRFDRNYTNNINFEAAFISNTYAKAINGTFTTNVHMSDNIVLNTVSGGTLGVNANAFLVHLSQDVTFSGNEIDNTERDGIKCESCKDATITNNEIRHVFLSGSNYPAIALQCDGVNVVVDHNVFDDVPAGVNSNGGSCSGFGYQNVQVSNNVMTNIHGTAINDAIEYIPSSSWPSSGFRATDNLITGVQRYGIFLDLLNAPSTDIVASGNTIVTNGLTSNVGIYLAASGGVTHTGISVTHNHIDMGNVSSSGGIRFDTSGGALYADVTLNDNNIITGAAHTAILAAASSIASGRMVGNWTDGVTSTMGASGITLGDSAFSGPVTFTGPSFSATPTGAITLTAGSVSTWDSDGGTVKATHVTTSSATLLDVGDGLATGVVLSTSSGTVFSAADILQFSSTDATGKTINIATSATDTAGQALTLRSGGAGQISSSVSALAGGATNIFSSAGSNATATVPAGQAGGINIQPTAGGAGAVGQAPANGITTSILGGPCGADGGSGLACTTSGGVSIQAGATTNSGGYGTVSIQTSHGATSIGNSGSTTTLTNGSTVAITGVTFSGSSTFSSSQTMAALLLSNSSSQIDTTGANLLSLGGGTATGVVLGRSSGSNFTAADVFQFSSLDATGKTLNVATSAVDTAGQSLTTRAGAGGAGSVTGGGTGGNRVDAAGAGGNAVASTAPAGAGGQNSSTGGQGGTGATGEAPGGGGAWLGGGGDCGADGGSGLNCNGGSASLNGGNKRNSGTDGATNIGNLRGAVNIGNSGNTTTFASGSTVALASTTVSGAPTWSSAQTMPAITLSNTTNQIVAGVTNTDTLSFTAPSASRTITFGDPGGNDSIAYLAASQTFTNHTWSGGTFSGTIAGTPTISGAWTWSSAQTFPAATLSNTTNQIALGAASHLVTISSTAPAAAAQTLTIPDTGGAATFAFTNFAQTFSAAQTFNSGDAKINNAGNTFATTLATNATAARTWTLPDATDTAAGLGVTQSWTGVNTFGSGDLIGTAGTGTQTGAVPVTVFSSVANTGSSTTGQVTVATYTMPANTLSANGQRLHISMLALHANNTNSNQQQLFFNGSNINTITGNIANAMVAHDCTLIRTSSTTASYSCRSFSGTSSASGGGTITGLNFGSSIAIAQEFNTATANNDLVGEGFVVEWISN
jgi:hypothetical protein